MTDGDSPKYQMTLSLNVLKHLGLGLYSNVPAVLSEAVANAWDADAERVTIDIEIVCVVGRRLRDWDDSPTGEGRSRESLGALNARVVSYDELIDNAQRAYQDYLDRADEEGRVYNLINSIAVEDVAAISPA